MRSGLVLASSSIIGLCLMLAANGAGADVFRCKGADGRTLYGDSPCPDGSAASNEISQQVGACVTEACEEKRRAQSELALRRLQDDKAELARMQELRIRQEEAWAKVLADRLAAAPAYEPREEYWVGGGYPGWFWWPHGRHGSHKCTSGPHCLSMAKPREGQGHGGHRRLAPEKTMSRARAGMDR
jgi:hypothetical protein